MAWLIKYQKPIVVALAVGAAACVVGGTVWAVRLPPGDREAALGVLTIFVGVAAPLVVGALSMLSGSGQADYRSVDLLADELAKKVLNDCEKEADQRELLGDDPIPIRWCRDARVMGDVTTAVGRPGTRPKFRPLPGHTRITEKDLEADGGRHELYRLFAGLASGRVVVAGAAGSGKTGAAILLLCDVLNFRQDLDDCGKARRVPVPVLLSAYGWNPATSVEEWMSRQLVAKYTDTGFKLNLGEATQLVSERDKVSLILEGFDGMDETLRPAALKALNKAPFRVVVLTRSDEMIKTAANTLLAGAVAVHLDDVAVSAAADYLLQPAKSELPATEEPSESWNELRSLLIKEPQGSLAKGLSTPLALTLLRGTYKPRDDVSELVGLRPEAIQQLLMARFLSTAHTSYKLGRKKPRYNQEETRQALVFLAKKMGKERDLAWWRIPDWAPATPRILATGFVFGLGGGLVSGFGVWLVSGLGPGAEWGAGSGVGLVSALGGCLVSWFVSWLRSKNPLRGEPRRVRIANWRAAIKEKGLRRGLLEGLKSDEPKRLKIANWLGAIPDQVRQEGTMAGLVGGFLGGLIVGVVAWLGSGLVFGLVIGVMVGVVVGVVFGFTYVFFESGAGKGRHLGPHEIWRNDRIAGYVGGTASGLMIGLVSWLVGGLAFGLLSGFVSGFLFTLTYPEIWLTTLAWLQLRLFGKRPRVRLMLFLEEARKQGVLRTVGAVYQFQHPALQDYLASQDTPKSEVLQAP
ncbi:MAG: hypothetical protein ACRDTF_24430 [Pseudonocardiaceae bacterium]